MAARQQPRLRRLLSRFRRNELPGAVEWLVGSKDTPVRGTKRDIVSSTLDAFSVSKVIVNESFMKPFHTTRRKMCQNMS